MFAPKLTNEFSISFIRHGHTISGNLDKIRALSAEGRLQAKQRALSLNSNPNFDLILTSSAKRAKETTQIIIDEIQISAPIIELDQLYQPPNLNDQQLVNQLLAKLGAAPLNSYLAHDTQGGWERYAIAASNAVFSQIKKNKARHVVIIAHGNIINSIGLRLNKNAHALKETYFDYCEGFTLQKEKCILLT